MIRLNNKMKKRFAVAGTLALGMFSLMFLTGSAENDADENSLVCRFVIQNHRKKFILFVYCF